MNPDSWALPARGMTLGGGDWRDGARDLGKVAIARRLRRETIMSLKWVANSWRMGSRPTVANLVNTKHELNLKK